MSDITPFIEAFTEKTAFWPAIAAIGRGLMAGGRAVGGLVRGSFGSGAAGAASRAGLKDFGQTALRSMAPGAAIGAATNVMTGDPNQGLLSRAASGAIGGGLAGGAYRAGRGAYNTGMRIR